MGAEFDDDQTAPAEHCRHVAGADHNYKGPVELKRRHASGQHQPPVRDIGAAKSAVATTAV